jgi:RNA polymerase sigma-70 factor (ECF subfamily)
MEPTDIELLDAWTAGDTQAGNALYRRYHHTLVRFFRNKVTGDLEDLVQQTLLKSFEGRGRLRSQRSFRSYLFGIAYRTLADHYRARYRAPESTDVTDSSIHDMSAGPSVLIAQQREHQLLLEALREVPLAYQVVLELYYWENLTALEIAESLEIPLGTAQTRLRRAKELLAERVQRHSRELGGAARLADDLDAWAAAVRKTAGTWPAR